MAANPVSAIVETGVAMFSSKWMWLVIGVLLGWFALPKVF